MKVNDAMTQYIAYRSNLGEKVRTTRYLLHGFGKYVHNSEHAHPVFSPQLVSFEL